MNHKIPGIKVEDKDLILFAAQNCNDVFECEELLDNLIAVNRSQRYSLEGIKRLLSNRAYFEQVMNVLENTTRLKIKLIL